MDIPQFVEHVPVSGHLVVPRFWVLTTNAGMLIFNSCLDDVVIPVFSFKRASTLGYGLISGGEAGWQYMGDYHTILFLQSFQLLHNNNKKINIL